MIRYFPKDLFPPMGSRFWKTLPKTAYIVWAVGSSLRLKFPKKYDFKSEPDVRDRIQRSRVES